MSAPLCKSEGHEWDARGSYSKCERCGKTKRNQSPVRVKRVVPQTGELIEQTLPASHFRPPKEERVSRDFRAKVLACQRPGLIWPGEQDCPVAPGETIQIGSGVSITVYKIKATKGGDHRGYYTVDDDRPALPRRTPQMFEPPATDRYGDPIAPTPEAIEAASIDGNYTQDAKQAVPGVGPEVDVEYRRIIGVRRRMKDAEAAAPEMVRRKRERAARDKLREALKGLDPAAQMALLAEVERVIDQAGTPVAA